METKKQTLTPHLIRHLSISVPIFALSAFLDGCLTLKGIGGDISLEGNPIMRHMMADLGPEIGLITEKCLVFLLALLIAIFAALGIDKKAEWVYCLAFTRLTRNWMRRKRRWWVAFLPLYLVALAQAAAAASWAHLLLK